MTQPFKVLYIGPAKSEAFDTTSVEQQSRAVLLAGGTVIRYGGNSTAELIQAVSPLDEQTFLVNTINQIEQSKFWKSTAIVVTWDDSDGWYDHQVMPIVNGSTAPSEGL